MVVEPLEPDNYSNSILLQRARHLDPDALAQIHQLFYPTIYRYIRFRMDDEHLAETITSNVFMRFFDELKRRNRFERNLQEWFIATASNLIDKNNKSQNKTKRQKSNQADKEIAIQPDSEMPEESLVIQLQIHHAIMNLPSDQQHILALRFANCFSIDQIAGLVKNNSESVKAMQYQALVTLRHILTED